MRYDVRNSASVTKTLRGMLDRQIAFSVNPRKALILLVPEGGLEPPRVIHSPDFESGASANSATPAATAGILHPPTVTSNSQFPTPKSRGGETMQILDTLPWFITAS